MCICLLARIHLCSIVYQRLTGRQSGSMYGADQIIFASIPNDMNNKEEKHYQTIFYLLFRLMGQYVDAEVKSAVGRADVVIKMQEAIYVFEFK